MDGGQENKPKASESNPINSLKLIGYFISYIAVNGPERIKKSNSSRLPVGPAPILVIQRGADHAA